MVVVKFEDVLSHATYHGADDTSWSILLTCEHASNVLPESLPWRWDDAALSADLPHQHWAIDIGAQQFALAIIDRLSHDHWRESGGDVVPPTNPRYCLGAVCAQFSRLLLDPNRPVGEATMFRSQCDDLSVSFNQNLSEAEKTQRLDLFYHPYHSAIEDVVAKKNPKLVFSIHSFNGTYEGQTREMEVGILCVERSQELARKIIAVMRDDGIKTEENEPWSGKEGFMYSAETHARESALPLMIEIRNDLLVDAEKHRHILNSLVRALSHPEVVCFTKAI